MFQTIIAVKDSYIYSRNLNRRRKAAERYEEQIAASQAKLAETTLVPGYTKIYA